MLKEHEVSIFRKNQEMFLKQEQSILALISESNSLTSLTNQRLDSLRSDFHTRFHKILQKNITFRQSTKYICI